ncbi:MAG: class I SAM-dependent methyltransferase [Pseudomonadota bacterium]
MATHQEIAGITDADMVKRMVSGYENRFDESFWAFFADNVSPHFGPSPHLIDIGCGPGLFLRDLGRRFPGASLFGFDITPAMIDYAGSQVDFGEQNPSLQVLDIATESLPNAPGSADLITMTAVLHVLPDPLTVLGKVRQTLKTTGVFFLQDWVRTPLPMYLERMLTDVPPERRDTTLAAMLRLFPSHNKFTPDDWRWLLTEGGFEVCCEHETNNPHFRTFVLRPH